MRFIWLLLLILPCGYAAAGSGGPAPIKNGFYLEGFYGQKAGGPSLHDELYQSLKENIGFKGVDIFCVDGPDPTQAPGDETIAYRKQHPIPEMAGSCAGAAYVMAGPFRSYDEANGKGTAFWAGTLHFYYDVLTCDAAGCRLTGTK